MPVYNCEKYLHESIPSILAQSFQNFEFIIINDGSTDKSEEIIRKYQKKDNRIIHLIQENQGIAKSLNRGIEESRGQYIARMDADDISHPKRFELQLDYFESNQNVDIVGCQVSVISPTGLKLHSNNMLPTEDYQIKWHLIFSTPLIHPALMIRKNVYSKIGNYNNNLTVAQDIELWHRISPNIKFHNISHRLLNLRKHSKNISDLFYSQQMDVRYNSLTKYLNHIINRFTRESTQQLLTNIKLKNLDRKHTKFIIHSLILLSKAFKIKYCKNVIENKYIDQQVGLLLLKVLGLNYKSTYHFMMLLFFSIQINKHIIIEKYFWYCLKNSIVKKMAFA
jgi:glycosyltransferase involved in cell wall biosynthesis